MPDKDNNSETASVDAEAGNDTKVEKQKGIVIKADEGDDKSNENEDSKLSHADETDATTKELSTKSSPLKPKTKEFLDKEENQSDDDAETTVPEKSHKIKTTDEDDSDKDEKKEKSPQKSVKKKLTAKENSSDDSKQEKSSKSQKRKAPVEEDSDADSKNKDDEEEEEPKKKSRKRAHSEEKEEDDEGSEDEEEELKPGLLEQPVVLEEGLKREKKKVQRLELTPPSASKDKKLDIPEGSGEKLGDIPRIEFQLSKTVSDDLRALYRVLYQRAGTAGEMKKNIRRFSGFTFAKNSAAYKQKITQLNKMNTACLKSICEVLDLERGGKKEDILDRLITFLMKPKSSGKALPKKKRSSTGEKSSRKSKTPKKKTEKRKSKKKKSESENEEDEEDTEEHEDEEEEEKEEEEEPEEEPEEEEEEKEESSDEDFNAKKRKTPKKAPPAKKASKKSSSAEENKSKRAAKDEKTKKKTPASKKRPRDSDSEEGSDEEPLKIQKTEPTNEELKDVVKKILEGANLEEVTMKTVYKQVFEKYPDFDLSSRKEFIKGAVKQIIR